MKHLRISLLLLSTLVICTTTLRAELIGLPVADTAEYRDAGQLEFMPGAAVSKDVSYYGLRQTYSFLEGIRAFLDLGAADFDEKGTDFAGSLGATFCLPPASFADLALRTSFYYANTDSVDIMGGTLALVTSDETLVNDLFIYSAFGCDLSQSEETLAAITTTTLELNPLVSLGLLYNFTPSWGIFVEGTYITSSFIGFGIKIR